MIGLDDRLGGDRLAGGVVEIQHHVLMKRSLISLQGEGIVAPLIDDLLWRGSQPQAETMCNGDLPLALSNERRRTLPSIATTPLHGSEKLAMNRGNDARNCSRTSIR